MSEKKSFWMTLPGVLTALGGLIGAIAALITALYTAGVLQRKPQETSVAPVEKVMELPEEVKPIKAERISEDAYKFVDAVYGRGKIAQNCWDLLKVLEELHNNWTDSRPVPPDGTHTIMYPERKKTATIGDLAFDRHERLMRVKHDQVCK